MTDDGSVAPEKVEGHVSLDIAPDGMSTEVANEQRAMQRTIDS